ncbi:TetR/AcrR family transcriptional regulator [Nocardia niigatensis]|uniref:TetR/AcrR family transcriptional regulator n=1 Tax=Nocardia niigatensis TaxID=209249 RepID=UPI0003167681|nr:TetR/AcrR family transcriptional regulator [Nocardia niigatensis]
MAIKQDYFDTALELLSEQGYSALKQATLCKRLRVTTGSFYHYFENWHDFTSQLLEHWQAERTTQLVEAAQQHRDPLAQLDALLRFALALPHRAEAAIRVWSKVDPEVRSIQDAVDAQRLEVVAHAARAILDDEEEALHHARWGLYLLAGYQELDSGENPEALEWVLSRLLQELRDRSVEKRHVAPI